jgi:hypothetical protein
MNLPRVFFPVRMLALALACGGLGSGCTNQGAGAPCTVDKDCDAELLCSAALGTCVKEEAAPDPGDGGAPSGDAGSNADAGIPFDAGPNSDGGASFDAGPIDDAGPVSDSGQSLDANTGVDASIPAMDAGPLQDAGPPADAGLLPGDGGNPSPPDAGPPPTCGTVSAFADTFGMMSDTPWDPNPLMENASINRSGNTLTLSPSGTLIGTTEAEMRSAYAYNLNGGEISTEVSQVLNGGSITETYLALRPVGGDDLAIWVDNGQIHSGLYGGVSLGTTYDATDHRYWRIRGVGSDVFFEVSADRSTWNPLSTFFSQDPGPFRVVLGIYSDQVGLSGAGSFRDVNDGLATQDHCPADTLVDLFPGPDLDPQWFQRLDSGCNNATVNNGALAINGSIGGSRECALVSLAAHNLKDHTFAVQVPTAPVIDGFAAGLRFATEDGTDLWGSLVFSEGGVVAGAQTPQSGGVATDFIPQIGHQWLRVRQETDNVVHFEASVDGNVWDPVFQTPLFSALGAVRLSLFLGTNTDVVAPTYGAALFDNVNAP